MQLRIVGTLVLSITLVSSEVACATEDECRPTFLPVSERPVKVDLGATWRLAVNAILIGCKADLDTVTQEDLAKAVEVLEEVANETTFALLQRSKKRDWRQEVSERLNAKMGKTVVSDIFFDTISYTDLEPQLPNS